MFIHPIGLAFLIFFGILTLSLPRHLVALPIILSACFLTYGQGVIILTLDFPAIRIMILISWVRLILRKEFSHFKLNAIDKTIILWVIVSVVTYTILWQTSGAFINRLGLAYNALGLYFLFRLTISNLNDIKRLLRILAVIIVPVAAAMIIERATGKNPYAILGGVFEVCLSRLGHIRSQGPFRHPILAGTFGAILMPLLVSLWWQEERGKMLAFIGVISATIIMLTSGSSGPLIAYLFGIIGLLMWHFRMHMRTVRWGILCIFILLSLYMKAPVYYIIARISGLMGGSGWHRSRLIEQAINHFGDWWLLGTKITRHWMPDYWPVDPNKADITNQYIGEGVTGGLLKMILFITIIVLSFRAIGRALRAIEEKNFDTKIIVWSMGAALLAHAVSFMSVTYFDQIIIFWYLLLAMISTGSDIWAEAEISSSNNYKS